MTDFSGFLYLIDVSFVGNMTLCERSQANRVRINYNVQEVGPLATGSQAAHMPRWRHPRRHGTKRPSRPTPVRASHPLQVLHLTKETPIPRSPTRPETAGGTPPATACSPRPPR